MTLLLLAIGCASEPAATASTASAAIAASLRTGVATPASWRPTEELTGSLEPIASVQLGFDVPGRIQEIFVERGQSVRKGDPVARLDASVAQSQLAQGEAALAGAQAQLAAGESALTRLRALKDAGGVAEQTWADAEAGVLAGRAGIDQASAAVKMARTNLGFHTLRSPIDGVITNGPDNAGILIGAGSPLFVIEDLSTLQLKATAPESASWLRVDLPAILQPGTPNGIDGVPGRVVRVIPSLDQATRRIPVEIRVENPPPSLRAHSFARARVEAGEDVPAIAVPSGALVARPEFCVIVQSGDGVKKIVVEVLEQREDQTIVRGVGLEPGAIVVIDPPNGLGA